MAVRARRVPVADLEALQRELAAKPYPYARPAIEDMPWGTRDMPVTDPFLSCLACTRVGQGLV